MPFRASHASSAGRSLAIVMASGLSTPVPWAPEDSSSRAHVLTVLHKYSEIVLGHAQGWP